MKKVLALLLSAMMVMSLLTACGGADGGAEVLKVWCPEEEQKITIAMCDAFKEAHPEFDVTFEVAVVGIDESENQLTNDPELAADVFQLPSGAISQLNDAGLLLPIVKNVDEVKTLYGEGAVDAVTRYNEDFDMDLMYGVPFSPNCFFMFYNRDMYTEDEVQSLETMMAKDLGQGVSNFSFTLHDAQSCGALCRLPAAAFRMFTGVGCLYVRNHSLEPAKHLAFP